MALLTEIRGNHLLSVLPEADLQRLLPNYEAVNLELGQVLHESGAQQSWVYFPVTSIISLLYVMEDGASAEIAVVGNEGVVGMSLIMGGGKSPARAVVQRSGRALRTGARSLAAEYSKSGTLAHVLQRHIMALLAQMTLMAACNRHHCVDQQLCRWLLISLDRLSGNELFITQELIANLLGVRREGVTEAALKLQRAGLIQYKRGHITVLDRAGIAARSCECYGVLKKEYARLLPDEMAA